MLRVTSLAVAVAAAVGDRPSFDALYTPTPHGYFFRKCVHAVPHGARIERDVSGASVTHAAGAYRLPLCAAVRGTWPMVLSSRDAFDALVLGDRSEQPAAPARELQLPADYNGWLEYANTTHFDGGGYDAFLGTFTVPEAPEIAPQVLYLFTGLQNIDWIPKVDPEPKAAFDIIQPVLQYPADAGKGWSVKSWWVTLDIGAQYSPEVKLQPGDTVFGNMTMTGKGAWFIDSVSQATGEHTSIEASGASFGGRLDVQPWAYVTLECYGCVSCASYPQHNSSCSFADLALSSQGAAVTPKWQANAKPARKHVCHESIAILSPTSVEISFGTKP